MVTLQALRTFARVGPDLQPSGVLEVACVSLRAWRVRSLERPYQFGHGSRFLAGKWPTTWYGARYLLDTLSRYPALWRDDESGEDAAALGELAAAFVGRAISPTGQVTPSSVYRGFGQYSFGQKNQPSDFATAHTFAVLHRLATLPHALLRS